MKGSELTRARNRLRRVTFTMIGALVASVIYLAAGEAEYVRLPDFLPTRRALGVGLIGTALAFMLYVLDTERKLSTLTDRFVAERAERLLLAEHEAEQRDFISLTAHELRTPLTVIKGYVATLATRADAIAPDHRSRYLEIVNEQTDRLADLVDDLMEVSRIESGRLRLACEPIDLPVLLRSLVEANARRWEGRVELDLDAVPPIEADLRRVEAIVVNLVDNAVKYSDGDVHVLVRAEGEGVRIDVADHGKGIEATDLPDLFQKFHRLPEAIEADVPGTGLGLYIVRALAEAHGGSVAVASTRGAGSTFTVHLPAARAVRVPA